MSLWRSVAEFLALKRNTSLLLIALVLAGTGEKLWLGFAPKYLQTLGASILVIGLFDALQTLLGALYAYESQFPGVASAKIEGLTDRYGIEDEETLRFFRVHETADVEHSSVCRELLDRLPQAEKAEAIAAGEELAGALWNFLSGVEARETVN